MTQKLIRVADFIPQYLYDFGVKHIFMLSGAGIMHLTDGLICNKKIQPVCFHHEQAAAMAVEAYAKSNNHFAVGYFTTGPGAINALTGTAGAWLDSVPCLYISGQVKRKESTYKIGIPGLRQCGVQEINISSMVECITKYYGYIDNPGDIKYQLDKAIYFAKSGRPGPSWLEIPLDVQSSLIDPSSLRSFVSPKQIKYNIRKNVDGLINLLKHSKRPVILAGRGIINSGATDLHLKFVEKYNIPVVTTFLAIDTIPGKHAQYIGRIGIKGDRAGNLAIQNSDLLLVLGSSLPIAEIGYEYDTFARQAKKVIVDIDPSSHQKQTIKPDLIIHSDIKEFLIQLDSSLKNIKLDFDSKWLTACIDWREKYPVCLPEYKNVKQGVNIYHFFHILCKFLNSGDIVITDAGSTFYAGSQAVYIKPGMRYITSGGFATMGYSLPAAIGASIACNHSRIMCVTGDGSFQQNLQELQTVVHYKLPIKIFILNNNGYFSIKYSQNKYFHKRFIGEGPLSGVSFPDAKKIAAAYGIKYVRITGNRNLISGIKKALKKSSVVVEIMIEKNQIVSPSVESVLKPDGTMESKPLEDMFPFLPKDEVQKNMFIG